MIKKKEHFMTDYKSIPAQDFDAMAEQGIILDVRTAGEHAEMSIPQDHILIPIDEFQADDFLGEHEIDTDTPIYILCRSGKRAIHAAHLLASVNHNNAYVIEGGILAYIENGNAVRSSS
jgi:rhodanese-related sulfurtransferase